MAATYEPIATTTLGSAQSSVTFSSISSGFTDLVLICQGKMVSGTAINNKIQFNGDTGTNYSRTFMYGTGANAYSGRASSVSFLGFPYWDANSSMTIVQIMNYSNETTYKTALSRNSQPAETVTAEVGLWRNTAAINSITISRGSTNDFASGSTFTLYGIKAA